MEAAAAFGLAFAMAFIGVSTPGMLNMVALATAIQKGKSEGYYFCLGASIVVFVQALLAGYFSNFLLREPVIIQNITYAALGIFLLLSALFFYKAFNPQPLKSSSKTNKLNHPFVYGMSLSMLNMLAVPYYLGIGTYGASKGWYTLEHSALWAFALGCALGVLMIYATYVYFSAYIQNRVAFIAKNMNAILGSLFLILFILALIRLFMA